MKPSNKHKITFKVLTGYTILGFLALTSAILILYEIETYTQNQTQDIIDQNKIIKTSSLIADIYENESLARTAIQLNSSKKFNAYTFENKQLQIKIDSLKYYINSSSQKIILDSIKLIINKKLKNNTDLRDLKKSINPNKQINVAINKLSSIDYILGKVSSKDIVENPNALDLKTRKKLEEIVRILNKHNPKEIIDNKDQKQIDSILSISKNILKVAQQKDKSQRKNLQKKVNELIANDLTFFRKLRELLSTLEKDILVHSKTINKQKEATIYASKNIIILATAISIIVIVIFSLIILNDFRKNQNYRRQLELANQKTSSLLKNREQLISMVSHDLRTPLTTIAGYSELIQKTSLNNKEKNYAEHIWNASTYMNQLVEDLLEFSNLENATVQIKSIPFNIEKHLNEIIQNAKDLVKDKDIKVIVNNDKTIKHQIISDPYRIKQILNNLVVNAYKFTERGVISIKTALIKNNTFLQISVEDTGIGISLEQQNHIFKAFTQVNNNNNNENGFGLGLTISKKLAKLLGGTLTLKSELNKGSIFTLTVPVTLSNRTLMAPEKLTNKVFNGLKAIVVEDDPATLQLLNELLKQYNIESHIFGNAKDALKAVKTISYDFVLTDIQLPKMNGILFMETLKKDKSYKSQPIIAMTGRANLNVEDYINSGFSKVLTKPFEPRMLQDTLELFFSTSSLETETTINKKIKNINAFSEFNISPLETFLNNDPKAVKEMLNTFLSNTNENMTLLDKAKKNDNITDFNFTSHKMLNMFKLLEAKTITSFLEAFETCKTIDIKAFKEFKIAMNSFVSALEKHSIN